MWHRIFPVGIFIEILITQQCLRNNKGFVQSNVLASKVAVMIVSQTVLDVVAFLMIVSAFMIMFNIDIPCTYTYLET